MMNIDKALEVLGKEVKELQEKEIRYALCWRCKGGRRQSIMSITMALKTVNSWVRAVKDKFNAPLEDEYR